MIKHYYQSNGFRPEIESLAGKKIIDIGGANSFAHGHLDALIDIRTPQATANHIFVGDIDCPEVWTDVLEHVKKHGKWDYAICTHTLEDINNPAYAARMIQSISHAGFIAVPSKYRELARFSDYFRGYIHHRWIYDVVDGVLTAFPKLNLIEGKQFDEAVKLLDGRDELIVEWEGEIGMKLLNDGMPYGIGNMSGDEHLHQLFKHLLT